MVESVGSDKDLSTATKEVAQSLSRAQCAVCFEDLSRHFTRILRVAGASKSKSAAGLIIKRIDLVFPEESEPLLKYCGFRGAEAYWYLPANTDPRHIHNALEQMLVSGPPPVDNDWMGDAAKPDAARVRELRAIRRQEYAAKYDPNAAEYNSSSSLFMSLVLSPFTFLSWCGGKTLALIKWIIFGPVFYILSFAPWLIKVTMQCIRAVLVTVTTFPFWVALCLAMIALVAVCNHNDKTGAIICTPPPYFVSFFVWCTKWRSTISSVQATVLLVAQDIWMEINSRIVDLQMMALHHPILGRFIYLVLDTFRFITEWLQMIGIIGVCPLGSVDRHVGRCRLQDAWRLVEHAGNCADLKRDFRRAALIFHADHISAPGCDQEVIEACSVALNVLNDDLRARLCDGKKIKG